MLRISVHDGRESTVFKIEGSLTVEVTSELESCWEAALERQSLKRIVVELAEVTFVDSEAKRLLTRMRREGVRLVPTGFLMNTIVNQIETGITKEDPDSSVLSNKRTFHSAAQRGEN